MPKPKIPNQRKASLEHKKRIERYVALVNQLYERLTKEAAKIAERTGHDDTSPFRWSDYPETKGALQKLQSDYVSEMGAIVMAGTSAEWKESDLVQDLVAKKVLKAYTGTTKTGDEYSRYFETDPDALKAFRQRRENGMKLSDRVWKLSEQYKTELEDAVSAAIEPGQSAMSLAVELKKYLNEPDLMFRRFRYKDENGQWQKKWKRKITDSEGKTRFIDCDKGSYRNEWTGPGYYKSSAKNAQRLARTEINMAYRTAEQKRWEKFDFVVGFEVKTTQNGKHVTDICDDLAGKYPKTFVFKGWHPMCMCYCIPILKTEDEFWLLDEDEKSVNEVTDVPKGFADWVEKNANRIERAEANGTVPYFIRDNRKVVKDILEKKVAKEKEQARIEANRQEYERLKADPNYTDVKFNPENGGLKASHVGHNFDKKGGKYEKNVQHAGFISGHSVILEEEDSSIYSQKHTEGKWDGKYFEVAGRETATENNVLRGLKHCAEKQKTLIAVLDFPFGGFDIDLLNKAIKRYRGLEKLKDGQYLKFERIVCVQNRKIVYDEPF